MGDMEGDSVILAMIGELVGKEIGESVGSIAEQTPFSSPSMQFCQFCPGYVKEQGYVHEPVLHTKHLLCMMV